MLVYTKKYRIMSKKNGVIVQTKQILPVKGTEWHTVHNIIEPNWFEKVLDFFYILFGQNPIDAKIKNYIFKDLKEAEEYIKESKEREIRRQETFRELERTGKYKPRK